MQRQTVGGGPVGMDNQTRYNGGVVVVCSSSHVLVMSFFCIVVETSLSLGHTHPMSSSCHIPWPRRRVVVILWCCPESQRGGLIGRWDGVLTVS